VTPRRRLLFLLVACLGLSNAGCLAVAAGCAAGGAAGYAYYQGRIGREYPAPPDQVWTAAHAALRDLNLPVVQSERGTPSTIESRTREGEKVLVLLDAQPPKAPGDPAMTRVSLRFGVFGDHASSNRVLDRIQFHLVPARTAEPPLADAPPAVGAAPPPAAPPTAPNGWHPTPAPAPLTKPTGGK
jgi:hypothetical protein